MSFGPECTGQGLWVHPNVNQSQHYSFSTALALENLQILLGVLGEEGSIDLSASEQ